MSGLKSGASAAPFNLSNLEGSSSALADALAHGPILLAFFKVSCPTCQYTFPFLERLYQQFRASRVQVWAISQDDSRASFSFTQEYGVTFPILIDDYPHDVSQAYGIRFVPTLFLISPHGSIEFTGDGFAKGDLLTIHRWFGKHFNVNSPPLFLPTEHVPEFKPG